MFKKLAIITGFALLAAGGAPAGQLIEREIACPVCRHAYYATLDLSDSSYDMRLDLKPVGSITGPWRLPDCPKCGFVVYKLPLTGAELARCKIITASEVYRKNRPRSTYFRVGLLFERLGKTLPAVASTFLKASWQEEKDEAKLKEDLELSLKYFSACAQACVYEEQENSQLLMGELLRRLGRFEEARAHLEGLKKIKGFQNNFFGDVVKYELNLCSRKNSRPHTMQDVKDFNRSFFGRLKVRFRELMD